MAAAADARNITVQYCMAYARHVLHAATLTPVTHVRVSEDYLTRGVRKKATSELPNKTIIFILIFLTGSFSGCKSQFTAKHSYLLAIFIFLLAILQSI